MQKNILKLMTKAINSRRCVAIRYRDQKQIRVIEPHCLYTNDRGESVVDGYQVRGYSHSGRPPPFWRPFRLKKINSLSVLGEKFNVRWAEGFNSNKIKYKNKIIAMVSEKESKHLYAMQELLEMGPFLPNTHNR